MPPTALLRATGVDSDGCPDAAAEGRVAVEHSRPVQAERLIKAGVPLTARPTTATMRPRARSTVFRHTRDRRHPGRTRRTAAQFPQPHDNEGPRTTRPAKPTGGRAESEPETTALDALFRRVGFEFVITTTPGPDAALRRRLAGEHAQPGRPDRDHAAGDDATRRSRHKPGRLGPALHEQRRHRTHAQVRTGGDRLRAEMSTCETASAIDPTDKWERPMSIRSTSRHEKLIQNEFLKNLPFALSVARSAADPTNPSPRSAVRRRLPERPVRLVIRHVTAGRGHGKRSLCGVRLRYTITRPGAVSAGHPWRGAEVRRRFDK